MKIALLAAVAVGMSFSASAADLYLRGELSNTDNDTGWPARSEFKFATDDGDTYVLCLSELRGSFKIASSDWSEEYGSPSGRNIVVEMGGKYTLAPKGANNDINWTSEGLDGPAIGDVVLIFRKDLCELTVAPQLFLRGDFTDELWSADRGYRFSTADGETYVLDVDDFSAASLFKIASSDWTYDYGIFNGDAVAELQTATEYVLDSKSHVVAPVTATEAVSVDLNAKFQTMRGFGASDAWCPAWVGKYWKNGRDKIAELLFSQEIVGGLPAGIGLSMWRVNLGGGTLEQGNASNISDYSRRAESFLTDGLEYDWDKCEGQRYFMRKAKDFGVGSFVLFSNTPPVQYTNNHLGYKTSDIGYSNLSDEHYDDFAAYMADCAGHFVSQGYNVTHISPVNEPQWDWDSPTQEGSSWTNYEVTRLTRELDKALTARDLTVDILLSEAVDYTYLYESKGDYVAGGYPGRSDIMWYYFDPNNSNTTDYYIGNLPHVKKIIGGHSYHTEASWESMRNVRKALNDDAGYYGLEVWQTEWSMLGDNYSSDEYAGHSQASDFDIAMYMSRVIHNDLTVANVSSWCFWTAMDMERYGHKDRFLLVYLNAAYDNLENEGSYSPAATLWVLGNYSRFIRPGYVRVALDLDESLEFFGSAWLSPDSDRLVIVYTNYRDEAVTLDNCPDGLSERPQAVRVYTTSESKQLQERVVSSDESLRLDPESVTTVVYDF